MRVDVIPIKEFTESMQQDWLDIQASNPSFSGPCFSPSFCRCWKILPQCLYNSLHEGKKTVGFLPFLRDQGLSVAKLKVTMDILI